MSVKRKQIQTQHSLPSPFPPALHRQYTHGRRARRMNPKEDRAEKVVKLELDQWRLIGQEFYHSFIAASFITSLDVKSNHFLGRHSASAGGREEWQRRWDINTASPIPPTSSVSTTKGDKPYPDDGACTSTFPFDDTRNEQCSCERVKYWSQSRTTKTK